MTEKEEKIRSILDNDEIRALVVSSCRYRGGATREDIEKVLDWAEQTRVSSEILEMVFDGELCLAPDPDNPGSVLVRR